MKFLSIICKQLIYVFFGLTSIAIAQKPSNNNLNFGSIYIVDSRSSYEKIKIGNDDPEVIKNYLLKNIRELKAPSTSLKLSFNKTSPVGKHYTYQLYYNNIPVYNATILVALDNQKNINLIVNELVNLTFLNLSTIKSQITKLTKSSFVKNHVNTRHKAKVDFKHEVNICVTKENEAFAVQKIETSSKNDDGGFDIISLVDQNGVTVYQKDLRRYYKTHCSGAVFDDSITVSVFKPNPITTSHTVTGGPFLDNNDADNASLTAARFNVKVLATFLNGTYSLANKYCIMKDLTAPSNTPPTQTNPVFNFTRNPDQFEEVGAFYHVTTMQEYIQSIGFNNLCNFQTTCDAHGTTADNSYFTPGPNTLSIGDGCVDDGEDADVFIHEYGHAISHSANGNNFSSADRGALDEAFGDYFAVTYRRPQDAFDWAYVFPWDGIASCWGGRRADRTKVYPGGLVNEVHSDGEIWASAMMSIWTILGKNITDKLQFSSLYNWTNNMKMTDAAQLVINADNSLNSGANFATLCTQFKKYGLYSGDCTIGIDDQIFSSKQVLMKNSSAFCIGDGDLFIEIPTTEAKINFEVFDIMGRKVFQNFKENTNTISLNPKDFETGTYLLNIKTADKNFTTKILRIN